MPYMAGAGGVAGYFGQKGDQGCLLHRVNRCEPSAGQSRQHWSASLAPAASEWIASVGQQLSWDVSPDAKVYTFKLRPGVKFQDGTPCDAEAIKFNIDRNWDPSHPFYSKSGDGANALGYKGLDKVEVLDASTVRVTQKAPFADFLNVLAFGTYSIGSPTQIQKVGNDEFGNQRERVQHHTGALSS